MVQFYKVVQNFEDFEILKLSFEPIFDQVARFFDELWTN